MITTEPSSRIPEAAWLYAILIFPSDTSGSDITPEKSNIRLTGAMSFIASETRKILTITGDANNASDNIAACKLFFASTDASIVKLIVKKNPAIESSAASTITIPSVLAAGQSWYKNGSTN